MTEPAQHEIVIVRRKRSGGHEAHHGGVWKIAFADFMTALMAFFLVLWIVNSTSKETRSSVARYFNPIKLADTTPARKGLQTSKDDEFEEVKSESNAKPKAKETAAKAAGEGGAEESAKRPGDTGGHPTNSRVAIGKLQPPGIMSAGEWQATMPDAALQDDPMAALDAIAGPPPSPTQDEFLDPFENLPFTTAPRSSANSTRIPAKSASAPRGSVASAPAKAAGAPETDNGELAAAEALKSKLESTLSDTEIGRRAPIVAVRLVPEGLLISLNDSPDFSMFALGSAEPQKKTIEAIGRIGAILKPQNTSIVVRGFTDSRRFSGKGSDNWKLSAARAQMAVYMLTRGGVAETRFERVEAHADKSPIEGRPRSAPENRRVEILVRAVAERR